MLNHGLDADLKQVLEEDVNDLARYNILLYLHDRPNVSGNAGYFADELGLRSHERTVEALEALVKCDLLIKRDEEALDGSRYFLNRDPSRMELVDRLYNLKYSSIYGEIIERLAARSLHKAKQAQSAGRNGHRNGHH